MREFLIETYESALREWDLDGFKLDFVDSFGASRETGGGRDHDGVPEAVDRLLEDTIERLRRIKPDVMVEFRQSYVGPLMRKYGNMFRAMDCPNDAVENRMHTLDIRLLCEDTAAHSDMLMWHAEDPVHSAALQLVNVLFSVPRSRFFSTGYRPNTWRCCASGWASGANIATCFWTALWNRCTPRRSTPLCSRARSRSWPQQRTETRSLRSKKRFPQRYLS